MKLYAHYSAMDQSFRKFKQAGHTVAYLHMKTSIPIRKINRLSLRNAVALAKKHGLDYSKDWRDYPNFWKERPDHKENTIIGLMEAFKSDINDYEFAIEDWNLILISNILKAELIDYLNRNNDKLIIMVISPDSYSVGIKNGDALSFNEVSPETMDNLDKLIELLK